MTFKETDVNTAVTQRIQQAQCIGVYISSTSYSEHSVVVANIPVFKDSKAILMQPHFDWNFSTRFLQWNIEKPCSGALDFDFYWKIVERRKRRREDQEQSSKTHHPNVHIYKRRCLIEVSIKQEIGQVSGDDRWLQWQFKSYACGTSLHLLTQRWTVPAQGHQHLHSDFSH
jgi:hypothetical protein